MSAAPPAPGPRIVGPVAIVVSRFPLVTETFILRELDELERQGVPVVLVPLLRERPATVHPEAEPWIERAAWAPTARTPGAASRSSRLRSLTDFASAVVASRGRTLAAVGRTWWSARGSANALAGAVLFGPAAAAHSRTLRRLGVRHVHAHFATHPALAGALMAHDCGVPFSMTVHAHDLFVTQAGLAWKVRRSAFVRCISAFNARWLTERLGTRVATASKLRVIHCGIDVERYASAPRDRPKDHGAPVRVLCVAALQPYKGVTHLVEAVARLRAEGLDARCDVVGGGALRESLADQIAASGLGDAFRLLGHRTQEELVAMLRDCDVFALPSIVAPDGQMEGIPVALMEAMAAGVPVVASRLSGIPELVEDGVTGLLVEPGDASALALAIRSVAEDPDAAERRVVHALRHVRAAFDLRAVTALLADELDAHGALAPGLAPGVVELATEASAHLCGPDARRVGLSRWGISQDATRAHLLVPGSPPGRFVAKRHHDPPHATVAAAKRAANEAAALRALGPLGLTPSLRATSPEARLVVMDEVTGTPLDEVIRQSRWRREARAALSGLSAAGRLLRSIQDADGPPRAPDAFTHEAVRARLLAEIRSDAALAGSALSASRLAGIAALAEDAATVGTWGHQPVPTLSVGTALPPSPPPATRPCPVHADPCSCVGVTPPRGMGHSDDDTCWSHGDFWPGNVMLSGERAVALDLEGLRPGLPGEDAASFLEHLALLLPRRLSLGRLTDRRQAFEAAFLQGWGRPAPPWPLRAAKALRIASLGASRSGLHRLRIAARLGELLSDARLDGREPARAATMSGRR